MQKSTSDVVPPNAAATVPDVKSSQVVVPPKNISMCVCGSIAPGITYLPLASITLSASTSSDRPISRHGAVLGVDVADVVVGRGHDAPALDQHGHKRSSPFYSDGVGCIQNLPGSAVNRAPLVPVGRLLERLGGPRGRGRPRRGGPSAHRPTGRPSTKPQGTLVTGRPSSDAGELYGHDQQPVVGRDRVAGAARRSASPARRAGRSRRARARTASAAQFRARAGPVTYAVDGRSRPASSARADVGPVVGEPRAQPGQVDGRSLREHHELRDRRDLLVQRELDRLGAVPGSSASASSQTRGDRRSRPARTAW